MAVNMKKRRRDSVTATLPLPVPPAMRDRFRRLQSKVHDAGYESLNEMARERLGALLDDVERELSRQIA